MTMTKRELFEYGRNKIHSEEKDSETLLIMEEVFGITRNDLLLHPNDDADERLMPKYDEYISARNFGKPVQYIIGHTTFYGLDFLTDEDVLIPRFDTEILIEEALKVVKDGMRVVDICTGSGCIILSIKANRKGIDATGTDISPKAVSLAIRNKEKLSLDASFVRCDLFEGLEGLYDVIVSNPPYIETEVIEGLAREVKDFEPRLALDGGIDGLDFYRRLVCDARKYLSDGGKLLMEIGYNQGEKVCDLLRECGYEDIEIIKDLSGLDRVVAASFGGKSDV